MIDAQRLADELAQGGRLSNLSRFRKQAKLSKALKRGKDCEEYGEGCIG